MPVDTAPAGRFVAESDCECIHDGPITQPVNTATSLAATRLYNTAGQLTSSEFATFAPETTGRIGSVMQKLLRSNGAGGLASEDAPFNTHRNAQSLRDSRQRLSAASTPRMNCTSAGST